jgi:hypothetical protein
MDAPKAKKVIVEHLEQRGIPFVDVGMGLTLTENDSLGGIVRVTASTKEMRDHVRTKNRISFAGEENNLYAQNIQIAELNALNAALAVIKWKKIVGFYADLRREHFSAYTLEGNLLISEDTDLPT